MVNGFNDPPSKWLHYGADLHFEHIHAFPLKNYIFLPLTRLSFFFSHVNISIPAQRQKNTQDTAIQRRAFNTSQRGETLGKDKIIYEGKITLNPI